MDLARITIETDCHVLVQVAARDDRDESFPDDRIVMRKAFDVKITYFKNAGGDALRLFFLQQEDLFYQTLA
jgi:hypothetical protein